MRRNDVITKNFGKIKPLRKTNYVSLERFDKSYPKRYFFTKFEPVSKVMGIHVKFWLILPGPLTKYGQVTYIKLQISYQSFTKDFDCTITVTS